VNFRRIAKIPVGAGLENQDRVVLRNWRAAAHWCAARRFLVYGEMILYEIMSITVCLLKP